PSTCLPLRHHPYSLSASGRLTLQLASELSCHLRAGICMPMRRMPMPCPFPGMDPYLEHPTLWPGVHNGLLAALQLALAPQLRPRYYIALEERVYVTEPDQRAFIGRPD